jgi:hypothetical protein
MKSLGLLVFAAYGAGLLLCGCGSSASPSGGNVSAASALAGNWLIVGTMPSISPSVSIPPQHMQLALTVDAIGNKLVAGGFGNHLCTGFMGSLSFPSVLTGTVAEDGTFSLGAPSVFPDMTMAMTGKAPAEAGASWPGSYTANFTDLPGPVTGCVETLSGAFTATSFPLVSGAYAGTASMTTYVNGVSTTNTMALKLALQQGGTRTDIVTGRTLTSNVVLTGSIKVQGSPCFSSGTMAGTPGSGVLGNEVAATFTMDDGSTLWLTGSLTDASESRIVTSLVLIRGGLCGGSNIVPIAYRLAELDRQS